MAAPDPGWQRASVLLHRGHGRPHLDIVLSRGRACPTLWLAGASWRWQAPHRRRYLTCSGPVPGGRGRTLRLWSGPARLHRCNLGWKLQLGDSITILSRRGVVLPIGASHCRPWDSRTRA